MEPSFPAVYFAADGRGGGRSCRVSFSSRSLLIEAPSGERAEWPYADLEVEKAGEEDSHLLLSCPPSSGPIAAVTLKEADFPALLAEKVPPALREKLLSFAVNHRVHVRRKWRNLVFAGILALGILGGGYWALNHWVAAWAAKALSVETEVEWGDFMAKSHLSGKKEVTKGPAYHAAQTILERLKKALPEDTKFPLQLHLVEDPMVNAFALPGGHMVLMTGLMKEAASPEEVAGVLAHEIQHILKRHVVKRIVQSLGWRMWFSLFFTGGDLESVAFGLGNLMEISYGRDQEAEADLEGAKLLAEAGLPIGPLGAFFERLSKKDITDKIPAFLSSHPASKERSERLAQLAKELKPKDPRPLGLDWERVKKALKR